MSQPVELSEQLISDALETANQARRSLAAQIEQWARLGQMLEPIFHDNSVALKRLKHQGRSLSESVENDDP